MGVLDARLAIRPVMSVIRPAIGPSLVWPGVCPECFLMTPTTLSRGAFFPGITRRVVSLIALLVLAALALGGTSSAASAHTPSRHNAPRHIVKKRAKRHHHSVRHRRRVAVVHHARSSVSTPAASSAPAPRLVFGIYPGGAAGTVGPSGVLKPEDPAKRLAALEVLRVPGHPFVLHIYAAFTGANGWTGAQQIGQQVQQYTAGGFQVEIVLTYRPSDGGSAADVSAFDAFVTQTVQQYGPNPGVVSLQVTNEANIGGAPNASDGYYTGAEDALISGVLAARTAVQAGGFSQLKIGFNWAWSTASTETAFWQYLAAHGGHAFAAALDWIGLDAYPGTWGPSISGGLSTGTSNGVVSAMAALRSHMVSAGIPSTVAMHISENGYPTGTGRTEAMQVTAMQSAINAINSARGTYHVTDYRWFDLRDADSAGGSFESQYGITHDDYSPKAAFSVFHQLVASLGA
jgi:hypothetical protein